MSSILIMLQTAADIVVIVTFVIFVIEKGGMIAKYLHDKKQGTKHLKMPGN